MDSHARSIVKALSWRCLATLITLSVALVVTGELKVAAAIGVVDMAIKLVVYYAHERAWNRIALGRMEPPEYQI